MNDRLQDETAPPPQIAPVRKLAGRGDAVRILLILAGAFLLGLLIQAKAGAPRNSFTLYPDEPSHFVASVMLRDYLARPFRPPLQFARDYYNHYPYFAIGYWPPLFYVIGGLWMLIVGVGREQALILSAAAAAISTAAIAALLRRSVGWVLAASAALLYLTLPEVQYWLCGVMVDQWVAATALLAMLFLIRYFSGAGAGAIAAFSVAAGCCVLLKYSGLFICGLPFSVLFLAQRRDQVRRRSLLLAPVLIAAIVLPWAAWTSGLARTGLPQRRAAGLALRLLQGPLEIFRTMPLPLGLLVAVGLAALLAQPRLWTTQTRVVAFAALSLAGFIALSPVEFEHRYLLFGVACLLILAFEGLAPLLARLGSRGVFLAPAIAVVLAAIYLARFPAPPHVSVRSAVDAVVNHPSWQSKHILVAADLEGPTIAEFAIADRHRPGYILERPSKIFATEDWFGRGYVARCTTPEQMMAILEAKTVAVILLHDGDSTRRAPHDVLLRQTIQRYPQQWRLDETLPQWRIYEYASARASLR